MLDSREKKFDPKKAHLDMSSVEIGSLLDIGCKKVEVSCSCDGYLSAEFGPDELYIYENESCMDMSRYMMTFYGVPGVAPGLLNDPNWSCSEWWGVVYQPPSAAGCKLKARCIENCTP